MSNVTLNSWDGEKFLNDNKCMWCENLTTTIDIDVFGGKICKLCLIDMIEEIDKAILESKG